MAETIADSLLELHRSQKTILIVVTHNLELAAKFALKYGLVNGNLH